jgi:hypothetical protein
MQQAILFILYLLLFASPALAQTNPVATLDPPEQEIAPIGKFKILLNLQAITDLRVREGQAIEPGEVIADNAEVRQQIEERIQSLESQMDRLSSTPAPNYEAEVAQRSLEYMQVRETYLRQLAKVREIEGQNISPQIRQQQKEKLQELYDDAVLAHARVATEQANSEQESTEFQLRQDYELSRLETQLVIARNELAEAAEVRSNFGGHISRIKFLEQTNSGIKVEITLQ